MDKNILDKHKDDPSWAEVIRLYSGLFDVQNERESFILDLAETDILLAAECKTSSTNIQEILQIQLSDKANSLLNNIFSLERGYNSESISKYNSAFYALAELNRFDIISTYLERIDSRNISIIRTLLENLPETVDSKNVILTAIYSKPNFFINNFLNLAENFEQKNIDFSNKEINNIFKKLVSQKVKCHYILIYLAKYFEKIQQIKSYQQYAISELHNMAGYEDLMKWMRYFELKISTENLIEILLEKKSLQSLHSVMFCIENIEENRRIVFLNQFLISDDPKVIATFLIYINSNTKLKKVFLHNQNYNKYKFLLYNIKFSELKDFNFFLKKINRLIQKLETLVKININNFINIGDIIYVKLKSNRTKHYFVESAFTSISKLRFVTYQIPKQEIDNIYQEDIDKKRTYQTIVIFIDNTNNTVYLSVKQLNYHKETISFNKEYLNEINVGEIVECRIGKRYEDKVFVKIYGVSKKLKGQIIGENNIIDECLNRIKAEVKNIINDIVYLSVKNLENTKKESNDKPILGFDTIKNDNTIGIVQKIILIINSRIQPNEEFSIKILHMLIGSITNKRITDLFPTKIWFVDYLLSNEYVSIIVKEKGEYRLNKSLDIFIFDKINIELKILSKPILTSYQISNIQTKKKSIPQISKKDKIKINDLVEVTIIAISFFGVNVKIKNEKYTTTIFIGELSHERIHDILEFQYNKTKLYTGQKLTAKVISIDEKFGIILSLKALVEKS